MPQSAYLRRLAVVALIAGGLGAVAQPPASASGTTAVRSATASPASADRPARTGGFCWNKPILPDWCQFDSARQGPSAGFRVELRRALDDCTTIDRRIEELQNEIDSHVWEPGDPGGKRGYVYTHRMLSRELLALHREKSRCDAAAPKTLQPAQ